MESYIGGSGTLVCPSGMSIVINTVHADALNSAATDVLVTMSGSRGTNYSLNALTPVTTKMEYLNDEDIALTYTGTINQIVIGYIYRPGRQEYNMRLDLNRNKMPLPWCFR